VAVSAWGDHLLTSYPTRPAGDDNDAPIMPPGYRCQKEKRRLRASAFHDPQKWLTISCPG